jgi:ferredoxin-NADP reductase
VTTHQFRVREAVSETPRAMLLKLDASGARFRFAAGQAGTVGLAGRSARKPYSIASSPGEVRRSGSLLFLVEIDRDGRPRRNLDGVRAGSLVAVEGPVGGFVLPRRLPRELLFVAGGSGVAPLRALIASALDRPAPPSITLIYSARSPSEFAFAAEWRRLSRQGRIRFCATATRRANRSWRGRRGRIRQAWIDAFVKRGEPLCFVCGPEPFVARMIEMLRLAGVPARKIRREQYQ